MTRTVLMALAIVVAAFAAEAQVEVDRPGGGVPEGGDRVAEFLSQNDGVAPREGDMAYLDDEGRAAFAASLTAYFRYRQTGFEHRRAVFDWQLLSSKIIFAAVIMLVGVGVYFSWLQFMASGKADRRTPAKEGEEVVGQDLGTSFEATPGGIKVSSPVLGVIILVISLAFFYLYLVHVYPISEIF